MDDINADIEQLQLSLAAAEKNLEEMTHVAKAALADLTNYRRRIEDEKKELTLFSNINFLKEILPVIDNFERAIKSEHVSPGIEAIYKQLTSFITKIGVQQIETIGKKFDTQRHEALMEAAGEKDIILEELEKGYSWNGKVIRPAKVKIGNGKS